MYSQNNEEEIILNFFKDKKGIFLDLGAYDGIDLSNTRALAEKGWKGVCVEPNSNIFIKLKENYKNNLDVFCFEFAIGEFDGKTKFHNNDTYYSTIKESELERWVNEPFKFNLEEVNILTFSSFLNISPLKIFNFINIDCEGVDYEILKQINLDEISCELICVETNSKETEKYIKYINQYKNFEVLHINAENLLMGRKINV